MFSVYRLYCWAWVAVIAATLITIAVMAIHTSHHDLARDVNNLEKIVKVDLPDIAYSKSSDNLDRTASRWDIFEHAGKFSEELSEESTRALDEFCQRDSVHWRKYPDKGVYSFSDGGGIDELYYVHCVVGKDMFRVVYEIDEDEGIFIFLPVWGLVLILISIIGRVKNRKITCV